MKKFTLLLLILITIGFVQAQNKSEIKKNSNGIKRDIIKESLVPIFSHSSNPVLLAGSADREEKNKALLTNDVSENVSLVIENGDTLAVDGDMIIVIGGDWKNNGVFKPGNGTVKLNGSEVQTITNSSGVSYNNLTLNNSSGFALNDDITVNGTLNLSSGIVNAATAVLTLGSSATVNGGSESSFINGKMIRTFASSSETVKDFPIGKDAGYRPVTLTVTHDTNIETQYTAEVFNDTPPVLNLPVGFGASSVRYWNVSKGNGANVTNASITLNYGTDDGVTDPAQLRVLKDDGVGNWQDLGGTGSAEGTGSITSAFGFTSFSNFTLGNAEGGDNTLPVHLSSFRAEPDINKVVFTWETASEVDNLGYNLYRKNSGDENWQSLNGEIIPGQGNTSSNTTYQFTDETVKAGKQYSYRLESVSINGLIEIIQTVEVDIPVPKKFALFNNYPNPFNPSTTIKFQLPGHSAVNLTVYDITGQEVKTLVQNQPYDAGEFKVVWDGSNQAGSKAASGVYFFRLIAGNFNQTKRMILLK